MRVIKRRAIPLAVSISVLLLVSCSSYVYQSIHTRNYLSRQNYAEALKTVEKSNNGSTKLVYLYEKGLILHYANEFESSNEAFAEAELLLDELYTRSLSREVGALLTSDNVVEYRGERFESAMIHYYQILNYLYLDQIDGAVVECRQLNHKLQLFEDQGDSPFRNDPFLQHLTGMVYRERGERVDAEVSFRTALAVYKEQAERSSLAVTPSLYRDMIGIARSFGDHEAVERYSQEGAVADDAEIEGGMGILNLFLECGFVPGKIEESISFPIYREDLEKDVDNDKFAGILMERHNSVNKRTVKVDYWLDVALPSLQAQPSGIHAARIITKDDARLVCTAVPVIDLDLLAFEAFEERKGKIFLKTISRALTKYLAKKKVEDKKGELAGWMVNIFNVVTESADTRSWSTLPEKILMGRLVLPQGTHSLTIHLLDESGQLLDTVVLNDVEVRANRQRFMNYRIF
jgi:tetratricopeptide (TPR) repeat protein